jgi:protein-S-isoprenylcysteine O-methyltransferase Ste14
LNNLYQILLPAEFGFAILVFCLLFFIKAPYGRFLRSGWGPSLPAKWAWLLQEFPAFGTILALFLYFEAWTSPTAWVFLIIWQIHYFHRTFFYPFQFGSGQKPYPVVLVIFAIIFNLMNGFVNGYYLFGKANYAADWLHDPRFLVGTAIFLGGYLLNKASDKRFAALKKESKGAYVIPYGGVFRYVSCPHYLGEILEWTGWAVLTWSMPGLAFAVFTFANLAPRAVAHHRWYQQKFDSYPSNRKALIPFIW